MRGDHDVILGWLSMERDIEDFGDKGEGTLDSECRSPGGVGVSR